MEIKSLPLAAIIPCDFNPRKHYDEEKTKELAASIKQKGVLIAIKVRPHNGKYQLVFGERRWRAAKLAGLTDIPAIIEKLTDEEVLEQQVIENLQREDVHPLEEAEGYEALLKNHGNKYKSVDDIAVKIGKSKGYVYGRLKLCELTPENRKLFYEGKFTPSTALSVARMPAHLQKEAGKRIATGGPGGEPMSYRAAQEFITKEFMLLLKEAPFDTDDALLIEATGSCTMCPKRTGNQKELFPDIAGADVCTDPECFKAKKEAGVKRALAKAKEAGKIVLSDREAKKVFFSEDSSSLGEGYISLEATCPEDNQGRKYKHLVKSVKDAKVTVGVNPYSQELAAMITKPEAARIRKQAGIRPKKAAEKKQGPDKAEARKEEHRKEEERRALALRTTESILENVRRDKAMSFLRIMAQSLLRCVDSSAIMLFMERREPGIKYHAASGKIEEHLDAIGESELLGFCLELLILNEDAIEQSSEAARDLCKLYKIETTKITAPAAKEKPQTPAVPAPAKEKTEPEEAHVKMRDGNTFEYDGRGGKKVVVKSKTKMNLDDQKKAGKALKQVTDLIAGEK